MLCLTKYNSYKRIFNIWRSASSADDRSTQMVVVINITFPDRSLIYVWGWYKHDFETGVLPYDKFMELMNQSNEVQLINLLTNIGIIADSNTCLLCGGAMRKVKDGNHWFWVCTRRVNGIKCNKGNKSIRTGTIFGNSHF